MVFSTLREFIDKFKTLKEKLTTNLKKIEKFSSSERVTQKLSKDRVELPDYFENDYFDPQYQENHGYRKRLIDTKILSSEIVKQYKELIQLENDLDKADNLTPEDIKLAKMALEILKNHVEKVYPNIKSIFGASEGAKLEKFKTVSLEDRVYNYRKALNLLGTNKIPIKQKERLLDELNEVISTGKSQFFVTTELLESLKSHEKTTFKNNNTKYLELKATLESIRDSIPWNKEQEVIAARIFKNVLMQPDAQKLIQKFKLTLHQKPTESIKALDKHLMKMKEQDELSKQDVFRLRQLAKNVLVEIKNKTKKELNPRDPTVKFCQLVLNGLDARLYRAFPDSGNEVLQFQVRQRRRVTFNIDEGEPVVRTPSPETRLRNLQNTFDSLAANIIPSDPNELAKEVAQRVSGSGSLDGAFRHHRDATRDKKPQREETGDHLSTEPLEPSPSKDSSRKRR